MDPILEICVDNILSAQKAETAGADRLEVCSALSLGGLTPSAGLVKMIKETVSIPIHIMIRPREGDFVYNEAEVTQMVKDIELAIEFGADGLVFGALDNDGAVDTSVCYRLMCAAKHIPVTFHRAFDMSLKSDEALEKIIDLKFKSILTSGCAKNAYSGRYQIKELVSQASSRISIIAGCGINPENLREIMDVTEADAFHASTRKKKLTSQNSKPGFESVVDGAECHYEASGKVIRTLKKILMKDYSFEKE